MAAAFTPFGTSPLKNPFLGSVRSVFLGGGLLHQNNIPEMRQVTCRRHHQQEATETWSRKVCSARVLGQTSPPVTRRSWLLTIGSAAACTFAISCDALAKTAPLSPPPSPPPPSSPRPSAQTPSPASSPAAVLQEKPAPIPSELPSSKPLGAVRVRRPVAFGLLELTVSANDGYEVLVLPASIVDNAPSPLRDVLSKARVRWRELSTKELFAAGFIAGVAAEVAKVTILHPLDTVKTRLQSLELRGTGSPVNKAFVASKLFAEPFAGLGPALASAAPQAGLFLATRDLVRRNLEGLVQAGGIDGTVAALVAVVAASSAYWIVRAPTEVYKLEQQAALLRTDMDLDVDGEVADLREVVGLGLRAFPTCLLTDLPPILFRVLTYKALKGQFVSADPATGVLLLSSEVQLAVGIACVFAVLTTPLDVLRTRTLRRLVAKSSEKNVSAEGASDPTRILAAISEIRNDCESGGRSVLFAGALPRLLWNGVCVGATTPLKSLGYNWVRDGVILELFDRASAAATLG